MMSDLVQSFNNIALDFDMLQAKLEMETSANGPMATVGATTPMSTVRIWSKAKIFQKCRTDFAFKSK